MSASYYYKSDSNFLYSILQFFNYLNCFAIPYIRSKQLNCSIPWIFSLLKIIICFHILNYRYFFQKITQSYFNILFLMSVHLTKLIKLNPIIFFKWTKKTALFLLKNLKVMIPISNSMLLLKLYQLHKSLDLQELVKNLFLN